jgi:hypothetical protein
VGSVIQELAECLTDEAVVRAALCLDHLYAIGPGDVEVGDPGWRADTLDALISERPFVLGDEQCLGTMDNYRSRRPLIRCLGGVNSFTLDDLCLSADRITNNLFLPGILFSGGSGFDPKAIEDVSSLLSSRKRSPTKLSPSLNPGISKLRRRG